LCGVLHLRALHRPRGGDSAAGRFVGKPVFRATNDAGKHLDLRFEHSETLWPWSGYLALYIRVRPEAASFAGVATGEVVFSIASQRARGEARDRVSEVVMPIEAEIVPTPPRRAIRPRGFPAGSLVDPPPPRGGAKLPLPATLIWCQRSNAHHRYPPR
jgi:hypothetical protein